MKILIVLALCSSLVLSKETLFAQSINSTKKDTLYYLVDTVKTPKLDRILKVLKTNPFVYYIMGCPCFVNSLQPNPMFYYYSRTGLHDSTTVKDIYIPIIKVKSITFTPLSNLLNLACKEERQFNFNHKVVFIEHLPNGKYVIRDVKLHGPAIKDD